MSTHRIRHMSARTSSTAAGTILAVALIMTAQPSARAQTLQANIQEIQTAQAEGMQAQEQINDLDDQTASLESEYKAVLQQLETLRIYNNQLRELLMDTTSVRETTGTVYALTAQECPVYVRE